MLGRDPIIENVQKLLNHMRVSVERKESALSSFKDGYLSLAVGMAISQDTLKEKNDKEAYAIYEEMVKILRELSALQQVSIDIGKEKRTGIEHASIAQNALRMEHQLLEQFVTAHKRLLLKRVA